MPYKSREDRIANATKWNKANPKRRVEIQLKWMSQNKDKVNAISATRRAKELERTPEWANQGYIVLWYTLAKIEEERTGRIVHVDHIIPLQGKLVSGLHCENNLQLLFSEDNHSKSNKYNI